MVQADCARADDASAGDWIHIMQGTVGRNLQGKESGVNFYFKEGQKRLETMARAEVLWEQRRTIRLDKDATRLIVCDGLAIGGSKVARKHLVTIFAATVVTSKICFNLLSPSSGARVFRVSESGVCLSRKKKKAHDN